MKFTYKKSFLKVFHGAETSVQGIIVKTDDEIRQYLSTGHARYGLRIKKIGRMSFEGRVSDKIRIVWVQNADQIVFVMVGNHTEVQKHLRNFHA